MDDLEAIRTRRSVRRYLPNALEPERYESAVEAFRSASYFDYGQAVRVDASSDPGVTSSILRGFIGSYGKVRAPHLVALSTEERPGCLVNVGWKGQNALLDLVKMGLGTCWIGGMFRPAEAARTFRIDLPYRVVAVVAFGHPSPDQAADKLRLLSRMRGGPEFTELWKSARGGLDEALAARPGLREAAELALTSPSGMNARPVRAFLDPDGVRFYSLASQASGPLDAGIFMATFSRACAALGISCSPRPSTEKDIKALSLPGLHFSGALSFSR